MAKAHDYCCCAIPLLNVGIYLTILEQLTVGVVAGTLGIATPDIVGANTPGFAKWIFAICCYAVAGLQAFGFIGVFKEKAGLFQKYALINAFLVSAVFAVAATWIIVSGTRHEPAVQKCIKTFFPPTTDTATGPGGGASLSGQADTICEIFAWVHLGVMGGLWVLMALLQFYLVAVARWYSKSQRDDHTKYYSLYSVNQTPPENAGYDLGERRRDDAWDPRPSTESWSGGPARATVAPYADHSRHPSDEKGYGVGADMYNNNPSYGYADAVGSSYSDKEPPQRLDTGSYSAHSPSQHYSPEHASPADYRGPTPGLPPGAGMPQHETHGSPYTSPQAAYPPSTIPSYHTEPPQYGDSYQQYHNKQSY